MPDTHENILTQLIGQPKEGFEQVYQHVQHSQKTVARKVLIYFDKVVDHLLEGSEGTGVKCIHVHIPLVVSYLREVILEFLTIKLFYRSLEMDKAESEYIAERLHALNLRNENSSMPADASALKVNRAYKKWLEQKQNLKKERDFLSSIPDKNKGLSPNIVLNTLIQDEDVVKNLLFATSISQMVNNRKAYVLHNIERFTTLIRTLHSQDILKDIRGLVLFDCIGRTLFNACNRTQLEQYKDEGVYIEHLILISFGKEPFRLKQLINKSDSIYQNHFDLPYNTIPNKGGYIFLSHEIKDLLGIRTPQKDITWIKGADEEVRIYWEITQTLDLPRLRTIYLLNIFMAATTTGIANKIIEHLFKDQADEGIFGSEVNEAIEELIDEEKDELEKAVTALLKKVVEIWATAKTYLLGIVQHRSSIALIVPFSLVKDATFYNEMRYFLPGVGFKMYSWKDIRKENIRDKFILSINYRDPGGYPFNIYPSIFENNINGEVFFLSCFLSAFFCRRYTQCREGYNIQLYKRTKNSFRSKYLEQQDIETIQMPLQDGVSFDDVEDQGDDLSDPTDTITVTYSDNSHATFYPSKMLIIQRPEEHSFCVIRADELVEGECEGYMAQPLEELYADLNLFEIRPEEEKELEEIKLSYNVSDNNRVLWKVLLARKRTEIADEVLYGHVGKAIGEAQFVRYHYFREKWLDPKSELLVPRRRKHFNAVCKYLELSPVYYRLKLKKSASGKWSKRNSTQKTNRLLAQMFNEGLFNGNVDWSRVPLEHLLTIHDLEGNGITQENIRTELNAFVALLRDNILMKTVLNAKCSIDA